MSEKTRTLSVDTMLDLPRTIYGRATTLGRDAASMGRGAWLTGLGAVGVVEDGGSRLREAIAHRQETLRKRGTQVERRAGERIDGIREWMDLGGRGRAITRRVETSVVEPLAGTLDRLGIPSRREVRELSSKVDKLTRRVNTLIDALEQASPAHPVFTVKAREDGWQVALEGEDAPVAVHATKDEALEKARELAAERAPSQLVVYRKDGTIQDTIEYQA